MRKEKRDFGGEGEYEAGESAWHCLFVDLASWPVDGWGGGWGKGKDV
ncbi:MAG: hypothetical protein OEW75_04500 [Cyclobacteriaceae bacterium]|nr:hypothetical protein [Cyclobacteriaceae bacterium]